jgi:hypothetical protein
MDIRNFNIRTGMGTLDRFSTEILLNYLTEEEIAEVDSIGYRGKKLDGTKVSVQDYLNSLDKGTWKVVWQGGDRGEFTDFYTYILVK